MARSLRMLRVARAAAVSCAHAKGRLCALAMSDQNTSKTGSTFRVAVIPVTGFQQNCSLVYDTATKRGAVVDPGGDVDMIVEAIGKMGLTIEKILLTHGHIDHAGGAAELREKLAVTIEGPHEADRYLLDNLPQSGARYGMITARAVTPDRWLVDGDTVEVAGFRFAIIHAPGTLRGQWCSLTTRTALP